MKITVSDTARISLIEIIDFLKVRWTNKEVTILKTDIKKFKQTIIDDIIRHQSLEEYPNIRFTIVGKKQVKLFYEIKPKEIVIKLFWHCKQDPAKLKYLLNKTK